LGNVVGGPVWTMGCEPVVIRWPPLRLARVRCERVSVVVVCPLFSPMSIDEEVWVRALGRAIGLDVHRDFCEVAICEEGKVRSAERVDSSPEALEMLAASLGPDDRVALEVSGGAWAIVAILEPPVAKVVVVSPGDTGIAQARAKTDRLDARTVARLLWAGELEGVWAPDELTRLLRRRLARREQLVRARSRAKNEIHAVLLRCLAGQTAVRRPVGQERPAVAAAARAAGRGVRDGAGVHAPHRVPRHGDRRRRAGHRPLRAGVLRRSAADERPRRQCDLRRHLPAAVGDIGRFRTSRQLVGYLGLDPKVRQSGSTPAKSGRISKRGAGTVRWALVEAAASVIGQPGPMHAYYQRLRARRGHQIAVVAGARKLAVLFWCLLTRQQQYAHQQPSPTAKKLRLLEIRGGAPTLKGQRTGTFATREKMRAAERALALQAEASYVRMVRDWQAASPKKPGASVTPERA